MALRLLAAVRWCKRRAARQTNSDPAHPAATGNGAVDELLRRELSLAAEHVHSIRWLLEIAREHQQPIPSAALKNLELVSKHLYEMGRRIDGGGGAVMEPEVSAAARRPPPGLPPRPPRLSFECRTSPSDKSTPSG